MFNSTTAIISQLATALPPYPRNKAPAFLSLPQIKSSTQIKPFNTTAYKAFLLFLKSRSNIACKRIITSKK